MPAVALDMTTSPHCLFWQTTNISPVFSTIPTYTAMYVTCLNCTENVVKKRMLLSRPGLQKKEPRNVIFCNLRLKRMLIRISRLGPRFEVKEGMHQPQVKSSHSRNLYASYCTV